MLSFTQTNIKVFFDFHTLLLLHTNATYEYDGRHGDESTKNDELGHFGWISLIDSNQEFVTE